MKLTRNIIIGLVLGILVGIVLNIFLPSLFPFLDGYLFKPVGSVFLNLIRMLVVPVVFFSIVVGTMGISDPKKLGRMGIKTISFFLITTMAAVSIAMALAFLIKPGVEGAFKNIVGGEFKAAEAPSVVDTLINIIPTNPVASMVEGEHAPNHCFCHIRGVGAGYAWRKNQGPREHSQTGE